MLSCPTVTLSHSGTRLASWPVTSTWQKSILLLTVCGRTVPVTDTKSPAFTAMSGDLEHRHHSPSFDRMNMTSLPLSACVTTPESDIVPCLTVTSNAHTRAGTTAHKAIATAIKTVLLALMLLFYHKSARNPNDHYTPRAKPERNRAARGARARRADAHGVRLLERVHRLVRFARQLQH